ncbi:MULTISPECIES: hypothetical protein [unclassified Streptomyces]|nr:MULTISPECIES: hypothetical protein [unclassified Streptomyces]WSA94161.1 hypothetical protein OIE63_23200 [Streptomyces sp. NBC_01795]WSB78580.1 hypothetical protein OHB04_24310 [Streptomyces sp. NBC_01775]WSS13227.1 hypothetical protein OG533_15990 [Streptomyces sp. NBC_01186]WSS42014.1 hypothetical protein OG220_16540 [Streptomyces sp. NBC_01187]
MPVSGFPDYLEKREDRLFISNGQSTGFGTVVDVTKQHRSDEPALYGPGV